MSTSTTITPTATDPETSAKVYAASSTIPQHPSAGSVAGHKRPHEDTNTHTERHKAQTKRHKPPTKSHEDGKILGKVWLSDTSFLNVYKGQTLAILGTFCVPTLLKPDGPLMLTKNTCTNNRSHVMSKKMRADQAVISTHQSQINALKSGICDISKSIQSAQKHTIDQGEQICKKLEMVGRCQSIIKEVQEVEVHEIEVKITKTSVTVVLQPGIARSVSFLEEIEYIQWAPAFDPERIPKTKDTETVTTTPSIEKFYTATAYEIGLGVGIDHKEAFRRCQVLADNGDTSAQVQLGDYYRFGRGVPQDEKKAYEYFVLASDQGNPNAQANLAWCLLCGRGCTVDDTKAVHYFTEAVKQDHYPSMYYLGHCYEHGRGIPQDHQKAFDLYNKAGSQGHMKALERVATVYQKGLLGIKANPEKAIHVLSINAANQSVSSMFRLANCYQSGQGASQSDELASIWYNRAASKGHLQASYAVAMAMLNGTGVNMEKEKAKKEARKIFTANAAKGCQKSQQVLNDWVG